MRAPPGHHQLALSWSGGKDSSLALLALRAELGVEPCALITTVTDEYRRVSMHGVRCALIKRQADALGLPLIEVAIPPGCSNELYDARLAQALGSPALDGVEAVAFGDLFLEDVRAYRDERLQAAGKRGVFPLWRRDTHEVARMFVANGFEAIVVCVDPRRLDSLFAGRPYDDALLADLPLDVDPCGENGEFHTFVHAGPIFDRGVECEVGEVSLRGGFAFCDVHPT